MKPGEKKICDMSESKYESVFSVYLFPISEPVQKWQWSVFQMGMPIMYLTCIHIKHRGRYAGRFLLEFMNVVCCKATMCTFPGCKGRYMNLMGQRTLNTQDFNFVTVYTIALRPVANSPQLQYSRTGNAYMALHCTTLAYSRKREIK